MDTLSIVAASSGWSLKQEPSTIARRYRFGYCYSPGCPQADKAWASGLQPSPVFSFPLAMLPRGRESQTIVACVVDTHKDALMVAEACTTQEIAVPGDALSAGGDASSCLDCLSGLSASETATDAFSCIFQATACISGNAMDAATVEPHLLKALDWIGQQLQQLPIDPGVLSSCLEAKGAITASQPSPSVLSNTVAAIRLATNHLQASSFGDAESVRGLAAAALRVLGAAEVKYKEATSGLDATGSNMEFTANSQAAKEHIGDAIMSGLVPGDTVTVATGQLRQLAAAIDTSVVQNMTFSVSSPEPSAGGAGRRLRAIRPELEVNMPSGLMEACNAAADLCPQPLAMKVSYTADSTYLLLGLGSEAFVNAAAEYSGVEPAGLIAHLVSGQIGLEIPSMAPGARRSLLGTWTSLRFPLDLQVVGSAVHDGKLCARIDYASLRPVVTGLAVNDGSVVTCEVDTAGDYVVLQLSYQLRAPEQPGYSQAKPIEFLPRQDAVREPTPSPFNVVFVGGVVGMTVAAILCAAAFWYFYRPPEPEDLGFFFDDEGVPLMPRRPLMRQSQFGRDQIVATEMETGEGEAPAKGPPISAETDMELSHVVDLISSAHDGGGSVKEGSDAVAHLEEGDQAAARGEAAKGRKVTFAASDDASERRVSFSPEGTPGGKEETGDGLMESLGSAFQSVFGVFGADSKQERRPSSEFLLGSKSKRSTSFIQYLSGASEGEMLSNSEKAAQALIEMSAKGTTDSKGRSALHLAVLFCDIDTVRTILSNDQEPAEAIRKRDLMGRIPLHAAALAGAEDVVRELLAAHVDSNLRSSGSNLLARFKRAFSGSRDFNICDRAGNTALHFAAAYGHTGVIKALQDVCGPELDVNVQNNYGWTPLQLLASRSQTPLEATQQLLLSNPNLELTSATHSEDDSEEEIEGNSRSLNSAKTALHLASIQGRTDMVTTLLRHMRLQGIAANFLGNMIGVSGAVAEGTDDQPVPASFYTEVTEIRRQAIDEEALLEIQEDER